MKLIYAARFAGVTFLVAGIYSIVVLLPGYRLLAAGQQQQGWLAAVMPQLTLGGWIWLLAVLAWMTLLVTLMHSYSPAYRISTIMQSGLIIIAAVFFMLGVVVEMNTLQIAATVDGSRFPDAQIRYGNSSAAINALAVLRAGLLMGGGVSAWIGIDLAMLRKLPTLWLAPEILAGVVLATAPFLGLSVWQLLAALAGFVVFCLVLAARRTLPESFPPLG